jgi:hypothetical protein
MSILQLERNRPTLLPFEIVGAGCSSWDPKPAHVDTPNYLCSVCELHVVELRVNA